MEGSRAAAKAAAKAKAKAKAKAQPKAQAAAERAQAARRPGGDEPKPKEPKKVGLQATGSADAATLATSHPLQGSHLLVDTARAAKDPVYQCQVQVDLPKPMNVDAADPRRVDADRRLAEAQATREANRPPEEKVVKLRHHVQSLTEELTSTTTKRLAQEAEYKLCTQLHESQADIQRLEKELTDAQDALRAQEALLPSCRRERC